MSRRLRLDAELVRRGLARSRDQAADLIAAGRVAVAGQIAVKAASQVAVDAAITVEQVSEGPEYVSRGGYKLAGALAAFDGLQVRAGAAWTPGRPLAASPTCCCARGAAHVVAVDVGYGQLAWSLQTDERVTVLDRVNVRSLTPEQVAPPPELVVADLSFISLTLVLPALVRCAAPDADFVVMVKPQFEVGREQVGGGVVRDPDAARCGGRGRRRGCGPPGARRGRDHRQSAARPVRQRGVLPLAPPGRGAAGRRQLCATRSRPGPSDRHRSDDATRQRRRHAARRAHGPSGGDPRRARAWSRSSPRGGIGVRVLEPEAAELDC